MLNDSAIGACVCAMISRSDLTLVSAEGTLRSLLSSNVGRGSLLLIVLNTLPLLFLAAIESGKERVLRSTVSAVPVVASALAGMFGHGVVYSGLLATSLLVSFGFTDDAIRPTASPPLAYVRVVEFTALGYLVAAGAIAALPTAGPQWEAAKTAFLGSSWLWALPTIASLYLRGVASSERAKEAGSAYRRLAVLSLVGHYVAIGFVVYGRSALFEPLWTDGTICFSHLQLAGLVTGSLLVALAVGAPITTYVRRAITGGPAYAALLALGEREKEGAVAVLKLRSEVVAKRR